VINGLLQKLPDFPGFFSPPISKKVDLGSSQDTGSPEIELLRERKSMEFPIEIGLFFPIDMARTNEIFLVIRKF
jgi:hypothetical protein